MAEQPLSHAGLSYDSSIICLRHDTLFPAACRPDLFEKVTEQNSITMAATAVLDEWGEQT
ncbi:hypothetical protein ColTof4_10069 [Colletotrichum tofieldiae]|nr:hypothetical protein ColTof3_06269 [Colletotrichum tofieldiae]GKT77646.1 hypothetical protein ColTof4_10069 [Colletotrichum tofieldiae]GKT85064.1 hypothetical protein Ct61P_02914 [Colletotrichum tofieldiae]